MNIEEFIKKKAEEQGIKKIERRYVNVSYAFSSTECKFIRNELENGNQVFALNIPGLKGAFTKKIEPFKSFAKTLCDEAKKINRYGFISTDELPDYGISKKEVNVAKKLVNAKNNDVVIFVAEKEDLAKSALDLIASRIELIIHS